MRQLKLGIYDHEPDYMMSLMTYINADQDNTIFAMAFSAKERLLEYLAAHGMDILLVAEGDLLDETILASAKSCSALILGLTEQKQEDLGLIYRYESAPELVRRIMLAFRTERTDMKHNGLFTSYGVISPIGRSGKTVLAQSICLMDEVRGGLYVGMEAYGTLSIEMDSRSREETRAEERRREPAQQRLPELRRYSMSDLAYLIKLRSKDISEYVERSIVKYGGIGRIASPESYFDLRELTAEDMRWFLMMLTSWGQYTTMVFDIDGSSLGDIAILGEFDQVIVPMLPGEQAKKKLDTFKVFLTMHEMEKVAERMQIVTVPQASYDSQEMLRLAGKLVGT